MNEEIAHYMTLPYAIEVVPEQCTDGSLCYRAYHPELLGCMSHGVTPEEAIENLSEARQLYIEILLEKGLPIPRPQKILTSISSQVFVWTVYSHPTGGEQQESIVEQPLIREINPIRELAH